MNHEQLKEELASILARNTGGTIPVTAIGDEVPDIRQGNPIPAFLTNTPRAGETAEQTEARYAPRAQIAAVPLDEVVNHPTHYSRWAMEPIEFIAVNDLPWWVANVVKYCMRYDAKDGLADMYKARSYLDMKIRQLEGVPEFWKVPVNIERTLNA